MKHLPTRDARRNVRVCALAAAFHPAPVALELVRVVALTVVPVAAGLVPMTAQEAVKGIV